MMQRHLHPDHKTQQCFESLSHVFGHIPSRDSPRAAVSLCHLALPLKTDRAQEMEFRYLKASGKHLWGLGKDSSVLLTSSSQTWTWSRRLFKTQILCLEIWLSQQIVCCQNIRTWVWSPAPKRNLDAVAIGCNSGTREAESGKVPARSA